MVVEFNGVPGSGKTTIAAAVTENLRNKGYEVRDLYDLRKDAVINLLKFKVPFSDIIDCIKICIFYLSVALRIGAFKKAVWRRFLFVAGIPASYICTRHNVDTVYIIDQGLIQAISSLLWETRFNDKKVSLLFGKIIKQTPIDVYIYACSDVSISVQRVTQRVKNKSNPFDMESDLLELLRMEKEYAIHLDNCQKLVMTKMLKIDTALDIKNNVELIEKKIYEKIRNL